MKISQIIYLSALLVVAEVVAAAEDEAALDAVSAFEEDVVQVVNRVLQSGDACPHATQQRNFFVMYETEVDPANPDLVQCSEEEFELIGTTTIDCINKMGTGELKDKHGGPIAFEALDCPGSKRKKVGAGTLRGRRTQCVTCWPWNRNNPGPCSDCNNDNCDGNHGGNPPPGCRRRLAFGDKVPESDKQAFGQTKKTMERALRTQLYEDLIDTVPCLFGLGPAELFVDVKVRTVAVRDFKCS